MKKGNGRGVLPEVVRFSPRNGKIIIALSCRACSSKNNGKIGYFLS